MSRVDRRPTWAAHALAGEAFASRTAGTRRANHAALLAALDGIPGVQVLWGTCPPDAAPYALPLWVDDAEAADVIYTTLRNTGHAVYRWDRVWAGTPILDGDHAPAWRRHLLQCLCHQSLTPRDMQQLAECIRTQCSR